MPGIRDNFFISILLHSLMVAAAFIAGSSSDLKVKRLIEVSLVEEWKTGVQAPGLKTSLKQQSPKINSVKEAASKPRSDTPQDISGRKEAVVPPPEAEIKPSPVAVSETAFSVNGTGNLSGRTGAGPSTSPAGPGAGFATQGKTGENASVISDMTGSRPKQGLSGDTPLLQRIRDSIESNLVYPYIARKKKIEGTALVEFKINQRGVPEDFKIVRSSGHSILDKAAKETVVKASPFPVLKDTIEIPITFLLKEGQPAVRRE